MKTIRLIKMGCLLLVVGGLAACEPTQQTTKSSASSSEEVAQSINSDRWSFVPDQALPQRGRSRMLNGGYEMICKGDTINCYLPYMGRAYGGVSYGSTKGPLDFTSTNFDYSKEKNVKGAWEVTIKPKDYTEVRQMFFTFYENGSAQLSVQFANRDPMSFNGTVTKLSK